MMSMFRFALALFVSVEDNEGQVRGVTSSSLLTSDNLRSSCQIQWRNDEVDCLEGSGGRKETCA